MNNTAVTIIVGIVALVVGFLLGNMMCEGTTDKVIVTPSNSSEVDNFVERTPTTTEEAVDSNLVSGNPNEVAFVIAVNSFPTIQQQSLRAIGVTSSEINITKGMVACGEVEIGAARMVEIQKGSALSMSEGVSLISCYTKNSN